MRSEAGLQLSPARNTPVNEKVGPRWWTVLRRVAVGPSAPLLAVIVVLAIITSLDSSVFLTQPNIVTMLRAAVTTFIVGCAATMIFTSGGIDLSVGAYFNIGGVATGGLLVAGVPWPFAVVGGLATGAALGLVNAALVVIAKVPPIIATLATFYAVGGLAVIVTDGNPISPLPASFDALGQGELIGIPLLIVYALVVGVIAYLVLEKSVFGYDVKAVGGNERAALSNGVRVKRVKAIVYAISGLAAAFAGILYAARTATADPQAGGTDLTFGVITAVLIGGTSLFGGIGSIVGTALGAVLFAEIQNALTIANVDPLYSNVVVGVILAAAVALDGWRRARAFTVRRSPR
jgi:ribose transport system permease protein